MADKLSENGNKSLNDIKRSLNRKEKMRRCEYFLCDSCDKPIHDASKGFIVHGNVYVADTKERGGLIGNNFPEVEPGEKIEITDVRETVLCKKCFIEAINLLTSDEFDASGDFSGSKVSTAEYVAILNNLGVEQKPNKGKGHPTSRGPRPNRTETILNLDAFTRP